MAATQFEDSSFAVLSGAPSRSDAVQQCGSLGHCGCSYCAADTKAVTTPAESVCGQESAALCR